MAVASSQTPPALDWQVVLGDDLVLEERVCRRDGLPLAVDAIRPVDGRAVALVDDLAADGPCVRFRLDLARAAARFNDRAAAVAAAVDVVIASPDVWLWTSPTPAGGRLVFTAPGRYRAALPFPHAAGDDGDGTAEAQAFHVDPSTWRFLSAAVFGAIRPRGLDVAGARVDVVTLPGERHMVDADIDRWLGGAAAAVATGAGGRLPFQRAIVLVEPTWGSSVPFGMVSRGGGPQALLLLGATARIDDVADHWVAVHELSHLLHPPMALEDAWLGEGLASYHQNVLRARAGLITDEQAWAELRDGFERGRAATSRGPWTVSLQEASRRMRAEGRWLQTYWGGAAVVLWLDVALRRCGGGSVDVLMAGFRADQGPVDRRRVPARDVIARAAATAPACAHIAADVDAMLATPFPVAGLELLDALGASAGGLVGNAPLSAVRDGITRPGGGEGGPRAGGQLSAP